MRESPLPGPSGDLVSVADVHDLVVEFYREVVFDELLAPVFGEVAEVDWAEHIPKLIEYWSRILLGAPGGTGPVMAAHRRVQSLEPITPELCDRWYLLWSECVAQRWCGPVADRAVDHAAALMSGMAKRLFGFAWSPPDSTERPASTVGRASAVRSASVLSSPRSSAGT